MRGKRHDDVYIAMPVDGRKEFARLFFFFFFLSLSFFPTSGAEKEMTMARSQTRVMKMRIRISVDGVNQLGVKACVKKGLKREVNPCVKTASDERGLRGKRTRCANR